MRTGKIWQKRGAREAKAGADLFRLMKKMEQAIQAMENADEGRSLTHER